MPIDLWLSAQHEVDQLVAILATNPSYRIQETTDDYDELTERAPSGPNDVVRIRGSIISFVDRLDDEFTKSLQNIDPHGTEYVDRLKDEKVLYCTISQAQAFYEMTNQEEPLSRVVMRRLEHIYSKVCFRSNRAEQFRIIISIQFLARCRCPGFGSRYYDYGD
jgi:translation initiation factor 3 subunit C